MGSVCLQSLPGASGCGETKTAIVISASSSNGGARDFGRILRSGSHALNTGRSSRLRSIFCFSSNVQFTGIVDLAVEAC